MSKTTVKKSALTPAARKAWNREFADLAREQGFYTSAMGNWGAATALRDKGKKPAKVLAVLITDLDLTKDAKVRKPKAAKKGKVVTRPAAPKREIPALKAVKKVIKGADKATLTNDVNALPCGFARVEVHIDVRTSEANVLKAAGFGFYRTGTLMLPVHTDGQGVAARQEKANLIAEGLRALGYEGAYASSMLD